MIPTDPIGSLPNFRHGRAVRDDGLRVFVGVVSSIGPRIEAPEEVRDRVIEAAASISPDRLGTSDDCGFSSFSDDRSTSRETAFEKTRAGAARTALAAHAFGVR